MTSGSWVSANRRASSSIRFSSSSMFAIMVETRFYVPLLVEDSSAKAARRASSITGSGFCWCFVKWSRRYIIVNSNIVHAVKRRVSVSLVPCTLGPIATNRSLTCEEGVFSLADFCLTFSSSKDISKREK